MSSPGTIFSDFQLLLADVRGRHEPGPEDAGALHIDPSPERSADVSREDAADAGPAADRDRRRRHLAEGRQLLLGRR